MQLDETFDAITDFIKKSHAAPSVDFNALVTFVDKQREELREALKLAQPGNSTIGISFEPDMVLDYVPCNESVDLGLYETLTGSMVVEVLSQDAFGLVRVLVIGEEDPSKRYDFFTTSMFLKFFKKSTAGDAGLLARLLFRHPV